MYILNVAKPTVNLKSPTLIRAFESVKSIDLALCSSMYIGSSNGIKSFSEKWKKNRAREIADNRRHKKKNCEYISGSIHLMLQTTSNQLPSSCTNNRYTDFVWIAGMNSVNPLRSFICFIYYIRNSNFITIRMERSTTRRTLVRAIVNWNTFRFYVFPVFTFTFISFAACSSDAIHRK